MTSLPDEPAPPAAADDEHALRLLMSAWVKDGKITSAAFQTRGPQSDNYAPISMFIRERLPDQNGRVLHVDRFASFGRARLAVRNIRSASVVVDGVKQTIGFDLLMTGSATPPLTDFGAAHAHLRGPTHRRPTARALAVAFNAHGHLERAPD